MQQNRDKTAITGMEPGEILIYDLYVAEGLPRGDLPYTANFDRIAATYNATMNTNESNHDLWRQLERVLKQGEEKIETYLRSIRTPVTV